MDTTYVTIMLVVFLVITGLAVDVGYLYVSEEDLLSAAESSALAGAQAMQHRMLTQVQQDPSQLPAASRDLVQQAGRQAALEFVSGKTAAAALVELKNNNGNALTDENDVTVGFWNLSSHTYTPNATPVNAIQVRTRRTAESSSVGMGTLGTFLAKISGTESFATTPVAVASLVTATRGNVALCGPVTTRSCSYPDICNLPETRLSASGGTPGAGRFLFTSLLSPVNALESMSQLVCTELPPQDVCGKPIYLTGGNPSLMADVAAMMYDRSVDLANKEFDRQGRVTGWWVILPVADCTASGPGTGFQTRPVSRYALVRLSRICAAAGAVGCRDAGRTVPPAPACNGATEGIYLDRIATVSCDRKDLVRLPGLKPVLVK
ncbi:Tad domain-containing protein [Geomonas sp. Red875]|uniref:Tad domain-containing protein n=2 Tax=Geomesophilobacter sediminis TaxID=2798584 RepID=A0A8J7LXM1_9BACT|nr:Tad domain-containing protein [Geomesophilobacter sediminis]